MTGVRLARSRHGCLDGEPNPGHRLDMSLPPHSSTGAGMIPGQPGPGTSDGDVMPAPGELQIKGRRSWATWQLVVAVALAILVGFALNGTTAGSTSASSSAPAYKLPTTSGSTATTTAAGGSTTTTAAGGSTTTTAAGGSATTTAAGAGPAHVLLGPTQMQGNWTSPAFTTTVAGWNIGWAFSCAPAPASGPSFQVFVTPTGASLGGTPAVSETGASGQSVTAQSTLGAQTLVVQAPTGCTWVVKVTGS